MKKNNNVFFIIIIAVIAVGAGIMIGRSGNNKAATPIAMPVTTPAPAVDQHGHSLPAANNTASSFNDLAGKPAPDFALADKDGRNYSLAELRGRNIVLFFNEGLMCYPACWEQIVSLAKDERFKNSETIVLSTVVDPPQDWQKAVEKMPELAAATVVFDADAGVSKKFNMLTTASSMHYGSLPGHTYVIIDKTGIVRHVFDDPNMAIHNNQLAEEITKLN